MARLNERRAREKREMDERRAKVAALDNAGLTLRQIAAQLGVSHETVSTDLDANREQWRADNTCDTTATIDKELRRLDAMLVPMMLKAVKGDMQAIDRVIRIGESRRKLLGLDAPTKIAPVSPDGDKEYEGGYDKLAAFLTTHAAAGTPAGVPGNPQPTGA